MDTLGDLLRARYTTASTIANETRELILERNQLYGCLTHIVSRYFPQGLVITKDEILKDILYQLIMTPSEDYSSIELSLQENEQDDK